MPVPHLTRLSHLLRYDQQRGVAEALNQQSYPESRAFDSYHDAQQIALALSVPRGAASAILAGYGLALTARAWADRPSDAKRAAIIQAGERLRQARPQNYRLRRIIAAGLALADAAVMAGEDVEAALLRFVDDELRQADHAAERCGRRAADLLDEGDRVLVDGFVGGALSWMLAVAHDTPRALDLLLIDNYPDEAASRRALQQAREIGVPVARLSEDDYQRRLEGGEISVYTAAAQWVALDGAIAAEPEVARRVALARRYGVPRYILAPDGPDPDAPTAAALAAESSAVVPPEDASAIVTSRGIYRPEMIARHLRDHDAPLDIITLS